MAQVYRFTEAQPIKNKRVSVGWWVIWILAGILFTVFVFRPDLFIVP